MEPQWYYTLQGLQQGPVPESQLRAYIQNRQVPPNEYVFKEGMTDWVMASSCPELMGAAMPPAFAGGFPTDPPVIKELSVGSIYSEAFEIFKEKWLTLSLGVLVLCGLYIIIGIMSGIVSVIVGDRHGLINNMVGFVIGGPLTLGVWIFVLNVVDGQEASPMEVLEGFKNFLPAFILNLLSILAICVGLFALIVGAIVVGVLLTFSFMYMADENCGPIDAMKKSFESVKSNFFLVLVLLLLSIPIMLAGLICFIVGLIPAAAFLWLTLALAYRRLNPVASA